MIFFPRILSVLLAIPLLTQCEGFKTAPPTQTVTGPFNSRGDYVEEWVDQPDKWYRPPVPGTQTQTKPNTAVVSNTLPEPHVPLIESTSPPPVVRTSPTTVKPKPKPKPKAPTVTRHTVKRGDTLSSIAKRYKSTVSKIQAANSIKGSIIRPGQSLKIPR